MCSQKKGYKRSRAGEKKELSKDVFSTGVELQSEAQRPLECKLHHAPGTFFKHGGKTLVLCGHGH